MVAHPGHQPSRRALPDLLQNRSRTTPCIQVGGAIVVHPDDHGWRTPSLPAWRDRLKPHAPHPPMKPWRQILAAYVALCVAFAGAVGLSPVLHRWVEHGGEGPAHVHARSSATLERTLHPHPHPHHHDSPPDHHHNSLAQLLADGWVEFAVDLPPLARPCLRPLFVGTLLPLRPHTPPWDTQTAGRGPPSLNS